ncbi:MAG: response regulator transcription factor [Actinomycetia bacterium]|nr:response regulator transcription factor [Actinomycetes bacterium]
MSNTSIAIVDDQLLLATALARSLGDEDNLEIVGVFADLDLVFRAFDRVTPDLLLAASGFVRDPRFAELTATVRTLVLLKSDVEDSLTAALESKAAGGVPWTVPYPALVANIRAAIRGEVCVPRELLGGLLGHLIERNRQRRTEDARLDALSRRERETLTLLAQGMEIGAIADQLVVSRQTVRSHVRAVMAKLEVNSRLEVIQLAREWEADGTMTPGSET